MKRHATSQMLSRNSHVHARKMDNKRGGGLVGAPPLPPTRARRSAAAGVAKSCDRSFSTGLLLLLVCERMLIRVSWQTHPKVRSPVHVCAIPPLTGLGAGGQVEEEEERKDEKSAAVTQKNPQNFEARQRRWWRKCLEEVYAFSLARTPPSREKERGWRWGSFRFVLS